jgi:hypothetical protein
MLDTKVHRTSLVCSRGTCRKHVQDVGRRYVKHTHTHKGGKDLSRIGRYTYTRQGSSAEYWSTCMRQFVLWR